MGDIQVLISVAQQQGYAAQAAHAALAAVAGQLRARLAHRWEGSAETPSFYIYRTGGGNGGAAAEQTSRPRQVLAFASADTAVAFAQRHGLGMRPRLVRMSLAQLLAALLQRPTIGAIRFVAEPDDDDLPETALPPGVHIERTALIQLLTEG